MSEAGENDAEPVWGLCIDFGCWPRKISKNSQSISQKGRETISSHPHTRGFSTRSAVRADAASHCQRCGSELLVVCPGCQNPVSSDSGSEFQFCGGCGRWLFADPALDK